MSDLAAAVVPLSLLKPVNAPAATGYVGLDDAAKRARIDKTARDFEGAFVSIMLGQMMSGVKTTSFGGGEGEEAFKSFLTDAMAKSMVKHGGVGLTHRLSAEMMKLQGLSPSPNQPPGAVQ